jgi:hypothetical protein
VETTRLSELVRPSIFASKGPSTSNADDYKEAAHGAAQWIKYAGEPLFEMCEKETLITIPGPKWTPTVWSNWKVKFQEVAKADYLGTECCELANQALERMTQVEQRGVTTNICDVFGFTSIKDDE